MRAIYKAKGYSEEWVEKRVRGIAVREELTDEWNKKVVIRLLVRRIILCPPRIRRY